MSILGPLTTLKPVTGTLANPAPRRSVYGDKDHSNESVQVKYTSHTSYALDYFAEPYTEEVILKDLRS